jgi:cysteinyl-tRNA synthetase
MSSKYLGTEFDIHGGGMDLQFPHHESEIAQSTICNKHVPARYWIHNNMITINGRKMGKAYNNVIKLTELFSGEHPLLEKAYTGQTIRFFILQTHYRSTLDFSNEALQASEKGVKRLWDAYEVLQKLDVSTLKSEAANPEMDEKIKKLLLELDEFMNDDFNTAKVLANLFELVPVINSIKDKHISPDALSAGTMQLFQQYFKKYVEDILGLAGDAEKEDGKLEGVIGLLIEIRKEAKAKKDYATSDKIRQQLQQMGILLKDEKDGGISYSFA